MFNSNDIIQLISAIKEELNIENEDQYLDIKILDSFIELRKMIEIFTIR